MTTSIEPEPLSPPSSILPLDDGTMETSEVDGTLSSTPELLAPRPRGRSLVVVVALVVLVQSLFLLRPAPEPDVAALRRWLNEHPGARSEVRRRYANLLVGEGRYADAFEEYLTIVRRDPTSRWGRSALADAALVAAELARAEEAAGLWTERWVAAADRYARYWPGDPLSEVLVEDVALTLAAFGLEEQAEALVAQHMCTW